MKLRRKWEETLIKRSHESPERSASQRYTDSYTLNVHPERLLNIVPNLASNVMI